MRNADMPINPVRGATNVPFSNHDYGAVMNCMIGLTKREQFAAMAMQGNLAVFFDHDVTDYREIAHDCVNIADALLKELEG